MKILFYSQLDCSGLVKLLKDEDNEVHNLQLKDMGKIPGLKPDLIIVDIPEIPISKLREMGFNVIGPTKEALNLLNNEKIIFELLKKSNIKKCERVPEEWELVEMWFSNGKPLYPANRTVIVNKNKDNQRIVKFVLANYKKKEPKDVQVLFKPLFLLFKTLQYTGAFTIAVDTSSKDKISWIQGYPNLNYGANYSHILKYAKLLKCSMTDFLMKNVIGGEPNISTDTEHFIYTIISMNNISVKSDKVEKAKDETRKQIQEYMSLI